jgi:hypothetical protein
MMGSYSQRRRLRRMDRSMSRSDPHLAAMLAIFTRLTAGEAIGSIEQAGFGGARARRTLVRLGAVAWLLITAAGRPFRWTAKAVARPWSGWERSWLGLGADHARPHAGETSS